MLLIWISHPGKGGENLFKTKKSKLVQSSCPQKLSLGSLLYPCIVPCVVFILQIIILIENMKNNSDLIFGHSLFWLVDNVLPLLTKTLPSEYREELIGISEDTGVGLGEITLFNVFYEFFSACTSIVAQSQNGVLYHGRNLDFGLFLGYYILYFVPCFLKTRKLVL